MTAREVIKVCCDENEMTFGDLAQLRGKDPSDFSKWISEKKGSGMNMKLSVFLEILDSLFASVSVCTMDGKVLHLDWVSELSE